MEAQTGSLRFLIDTGADVSMVKAALLKDNTEFNAGETILLQGIADKAIKTMGTTDINLSAHKLEITHKFHIVDHQIKLTYDGILGRDFWEGNDAKIDYAKRVVAIPGKSIRFDNREINLIRLKPRSETVVAAPTRSMKAGITPKQELKPGVYLAEALTIPQQGKCITTVINTLEEEIEVDIPEVTLDEVVSEDTSLSPNKDNVVQIYSIARTDLSHRLSTLREQLRVDHLISEERVPLVHICENFHDIFLLPGDKLTATTSAEHAIPTPDIHPTRAINVRPYRIPEVHKQEVKSQVSKMLEEGIIKHSTSPYNAPILVVPKKTDASGKPKLRVVVDFRKLNDATVGDSFPIPLIDEVLNAFGKSKYFSAIDCASGYHQIPVRTEDQPKTAFSTPEGHYEFNRMPFGLKSAPSTFQRLMNNVLTGLQGLKCLVYLDDVVIFGETLVEHNERLIDVFQRFREHNLKLQPDKCEFLRSELAYLGHIITPEGVKPDKSKIEAVLNFPTPRTTRQLKGFLGLSGYYRKFIPNYSKIAVPMTYLLKKGVPYIWTTETEEAFRTLKEILTTEPLLQYPDYTRPFVLTTDASDSAVGAILSQGDIGKDLPIAYASRTLSKPERSYPTIEKELTGIVWGVKYFRPYLLGRKFKIVTDCKSLTWLFGVNDPSSRLLRWRLLLEEYDYEIVYKKGTSNTNADALSRMFVAEANKIEPEDVEESDSLDKDEKVKLMKEMHDNPLGGHLGMNRTMERIKQFKSWTNMKQDIEDYIRKCEICQKNKITQRKTKMPLEITTTPDVVFEKCALDIVGPLTETLNGNRYLLTFQDELSKYTLATPLRTQDAETVAKAFVQEVILKFGIPQVVLTDQGSNFMSEVFRNMCKLLKIKKINTTAYHPETNGALERTHRVLVEYLRCFILDDQTDWDSWIPYAIFVFNTTTHTSTKFMPHEMMFGRLPNIPGCLQKQAPEVRYNYESYIQELRSRLQSCYTRAKENLITQKERNKEYYDKSSNLQLFEVGDKVLLHNETVRRGRSSKLDSQWLGPYVVLDSNGVNVTLQTRRNKVLKVHCNRLKPFFV